MIAKIGKHMVVSKNKFLEMLHMLPDLIYASKKIMPLYYQVSSHHHKYPENDA